MNSRILIQPVRRILSKVYNQRTNRNKLRKASKNNYHENDTTSGFLMKLHRMCKIHPTLKFSLSVAWWSQIQQTIEQTKRRDFKDDWERFSEYCHKNVWPVMSPVLKKLLIKSVLSLMLGAPVDTVIGLISREKFCDYISEYFSMTGSNTECGISSKERVLQHLFEMEKIYNIADKNERAALQQLIVQYFGENVDLEKTLGNNADETEPPLQDLDERLKNDLDKLKSKYGIPTESQLTE